MGRGGGHWEHWVSPVSLTPPSPPQVLGGPRGTGAAGGGHHLPGAAGAGAGNHRALWGGGAGARPRPHPRPGPAPTPCDPVINPQFGPVSPIYSKAGGGVRGGEGLSGGGGARVPPPPPWGGPSASSDLGGGEKGGVVTSHTHHMTPPFSCSHEVKPGHAPCPMATPPAPGLGVVNQTQLPLQPLPHPVAAPPLWPRPLPCSHAPPCGHAPFPVAPPPLCGHAPCPCACSPLLGL